MLARPQQPRALQPHAPPGALEQLDRRAPDPGLREGRERVGEEDDVAARRRGRPPVAARVPSAAASRARSAAAGARRRSPAVRSSSARAPGSRGSRFDSGASAAPSRFSAPDRPERARAQRRAVDVLVVGEELALERRHVDLERALALARLALEAEVEDLVQALVAERGVRVGLRQRPHERVRAAARRVVLLARRHVRRAHDARCPSCGTGRCSCSGRPPCASRSAPSKWSVVTQRRGRRQRRVAQVLGHRPRRRRSCRG